jgi:hypothetical protein
VAGDEAPVAGVQIVALANRGAVVADALQPDRRPFRMSGLIPLDQAARAREDLTERGDDLGRPAETPAGAGKRGVEQRVGRVAVRDRLELP